MFDAAIVDKRKKEQTEDWYRTRKIAAKLIKDNNKSKILVTSTEALDELAEAEAFAMTEAGMSDGDEELTEAENSLNLADMKAAGSSAQLRMEDESEEFALNINEFFDFAGLFGSSEGKAEGSEEGTQNLGVDKIFSILIKLKFPLEYWVIVMDFIMSNTEFHAGAYWQAGFILGRSLV
jgi:hypothetical protein